MNKRLDYYYNYYYNLHDSEVKHYDASDWLSCLGSRTVIG